MSKRLPGGEITGHVVGAAAAALAVTAASYIWRLPQTISPLAVLVVYTVSAVLLLVAAILTFRRVVRRSYEQNQRLTPLPSFLQLLVWGLFCAFPCIYNPLDWAWSQPSEGHVLPGQTGIGWVCVGAGLACALGAMAWLGVRRSFGQRGPGLGLAGPYRVTRNPQLAGGALLVVGYVVVWPSWYALGWLVLFAAISHTMVLTEEGFLHRLYAEEYERYCRRVPRYLGFPRRS
jgi:protein-S-isoprenylcysteine O-methyltransferase Ste14